MADLVIILILTAMVGSACRYIYKKKKQGAKCIGCSGSGCSCGCGCAEKGD